MAIEITIPRLGWSMEEGTFSAWLKAEGETVASGDQLFSVESDKVTMDVESLDAGILYLPPDAPQPGSAVVVGQRIGYLLAPGEAAPVVSAVAAAAAPAAVAAVATTAPAAIETHEESGGKRRKAVTPRARRVAGELGVDAEQVQGSGKGGRVRESDVRTAAAATTSAAGAASALPAGRRTVAQRMVESARNTVPVTLTTRAVASRLIRMKEETGLSYTAILTKWTAAALQSHPRFGGAHIGIAVDTEHGLFVPVIRNVPELTIVQIAARLEALTTAAHARKLTAEDLQGGTFTITNLGAYGIDFFTPVINYPEAAILGVGAIRRDGSEPIISLSLTFDHRVADGAPAARFLQALVRLIEQ